jgi:hypothetical protein
MVRASDRHKGKEADEGGVVVEADALFPYQKGGQRELVVSASRRMPYVRYPWTLEDRRDSVSLIFKRGAYQGIILRDDPSAVHSYEQIKVSVSAASDQRL